jgi:hypothetical protein
MGKVYFDKETDVLLVELAKLRGASIEATIDEYVRVHLREGIEKERERVTVDVAGKAIPNRRYIDKLLDQFGMPNFVDTKKLPKDFFDDLSA